MINTFLKFQFEVNKICFTLTLSTNLTDFWTFKFSSTKKYLLKTHQLEKRNNKGSRKSYCKAVNGDT